MPTRDNATSTSYKLEWSRFEQDRVTDFLAWQAGLVRAHRRPDQFVTQDFGSMMRQDVNEPEVAKVLDVVANNPYHGDLPPFSQPFITGVSVGLMVGGGEGRGAMAPLPSRSARNSFGVR